MKITRDNYEIWFLDYAEGRLTQKERDEVRLFMIQHPDLADELESFGPTLVSDIHLAFPDKEGLKKVGYHDPEIFESTAIAAMEGDLTPEELISFEKWVSDKPEHQAFINQLKSTRLLPDPEIGFPGKNKLKKKTTVIALRTWVAAAAVILLGLLLFSPKTQKPETSPILTAENPASQPIVNKPVPVVVPAITPSRSARKRSIATNQLQKASGKSAVNQPAPEIREIDPVAMMTAKTVTVSSYEPAFCDLMPVSNNFQTYTASNEIPVSEFLKEKLQELKADDPKGFLTREEVTVAGLRLFSRLPGNHLTGRKGRNGKLTSISFNTQLLAFSIPVNR
jgi:hypothetical protein